MIKHLKRLRIISSIILILLLQNCSNKKTDTITIGEHKIVDTIDYSNIKLVNESLKEQIIVFIDALKFQQNDRKEFILEIIDETEKDIIFRIVYGYPGICHNEFKGVLDFRPKEITLFLFQNKEHLLNNSFFILEKEFDCLEEKTKGGNSLILNKSYRIELKEEMIGNFYTYFHYKKIDGEFEFYKEYRDPRTVPKF